jgi:hypothetical protein
MSTISPTVARWYEENPDWASSKTLRATRNFGTSKDLDIYGFDVFGWNDKGRDRAGYSAADYAADASLAGIVSAHAHSLRGAPNPVSPFRKIYPASGVVFDRLMDAWPTATLDDALQPRPEGSEFYPDPSIVISRRVYHGAILVDLTINLASPDGGTMWPRRILFTFDYDAAMRASDPVGTTSFSVTVHESSETPDWYAVTDLGNLEELSSEAARAISAFDGDYLYYAISVEDDDLGGHVAATVISDEFADDERHAAREISGDYLCTHLGRTKADALQRVKEAGRFKTSALNEMLDRGIAIELENQLPAVTFG